MSRRLKCMLLLALGLGIFACNLPASTATPVFPTTVTFIPPSATPTLPAPAYQSVFEPAACAFPVPSGYSPECGYLGAEMKRNKTRGEYRRCLKCGNEWGVTAPAEAEALAG